MLDLEQIENKLQRLASVENALGEASRSGEGAEYRRLLSEHAFLKKLEGAFLGYKKALDDIEGNKTLLEDPDFHDEAAAENERLEAALPSLERKVLAAILPPDPLEGRNAVMEIRAGTGGEEAALFAGDLFRMYSRYAEMRGWKISVMGSNATSLDGYKEIVFTVVGDGSYGRLRFESGGHRVQRVPVTETQGRIHTSAATVVVFPEADEEDELVIPEKDIRIDLFCSGGAGGQHVNKTESAVRMTHLPTGLVAICQDERSQIRNREKCLATLKARILDFKRREEEAKLGADRLSLRGSGDRSERIRTYNFPQNRVTDHRIDLTLYSLDRIIEGNIDILLDALAENDLEERIAKAVGN